MRYFSLATVAEQQTATSRGPVTVFGACRAFGQKQDSRNCIVISRDETKQRRKFQPKCLQKKRLQSY